MRRRQILAASGFSLVSVMAGCLADDDENGTGPSEDNADTEPQDTDGADTANQSSSAEAETAVRDFYEAIDEGDGDTAVAQLHEGSNLQLDASEVDSAGGEGITIHDIEVTTLTDLVDETGGGGRTEEEIETELIGEVDEYQTVFISYTSEETGSEEAYWIVVLDEGSWQLHWQFLST